MIKTIWTIVKLLIAILPFYFLCRKSKKVNIPRPERNKQYLMPVVAFLYCVVAMTLTEKVNHLLITLIRNIPKWIAMLANLSWMPEKAASVISQIAQVLQTFLETINLNFWIFFVTNAVLILLYLAIKQLVIAVMRKKVTGESKLYKWTADHFYFFFEERGIWCIHQEYVQMRSFLKILYTAVVIISCLLMLVSRKFYFKELLTAMFYPVFGVIMIGELYFFFDGMSQVEYSEDVLGEDENAYRIVNYSLLRKFLRSLFGDKLLAENTTVNNALNYEVTNEELIRELLLSEDPVKADFAEYMSHLNDGKKDAEKKIDIDHNYFQSAIDLLEGKSILFNNPFYNDLIPYIFYPMNRALLSHRKVVVVLGRHVIEEDIQNWLIEGLTKVTNIPYMWRVGVLGEESQENELDVGIVSRSNTLNLRMHEANAVFFEQASYIVVLEPSKLVSTAQTGLNLLVRKCNADEDKHITYCLCDKNCDGLVDAMSHILMTNLTEVSATHKHMGTSSYMCWEPDGEYLHHRIVPNISRYLGVGTELSFAALKNQVSEVTWYGGDAFPVTDMNWIAQQYYYDLTRYAGLPSAQNEMEKHFHTTPNYWSAKVADTSYMTVEDESYNMFEILRNFSTRSKEQGFVNVISSDYLLKDYMADNALIFQTDPKAIPYIAADYVRTRRNTILRLMMMLSTVDVPEEDIVNELSLVGIKVFDLKKQLWFEMLCCYADLAQMERYDCSTEARYQESVLNAFADTLKVDNSEDEVTINIIEDSEKFNLKLGKMITVYRITDKTFRTHFVTELKSASYIAEDEKGEKNYLGAELRGQVFQRYLPGQFFTFGGKYYEMVGLSADEHMLVRRASDHISGRPTYRQIREYSILNTCPSRTMGASKSVGNVKITKEYADISVETPGYRDMTRYNDFSTARTVLFEKENSIPTRSYKNKEILKITLPSEGCTTSIRYTITLLLNEIFRSIFAENQAFISAVTAFDRNAVEHHEILGYYVNGDAASDKFDDEAIYIIEDSQLDLGLTVAVERNINRIFGIIEDYLQWHFEAIEDSLNPPPEPTPIVIILPPDNPDNPDNPDGTQSKKKKGIFARMKDFFKKLWEKLFKRKKKKQPEPPAEEPSDDSADNPTGDTQPETPADDSDTKPQGDTDDADKDSPDDGDDGDKETDDNGENPSDTSPEDETDDEQPKKKGFWARRREKRKKKKAEKEAKKKAKKKAKDGDAEEPTPEADTDTPDAPETPEATDGDSSSEDSTPEAEETAVVEEPKPNAGPQSSNSAGNGEAGPMFERKPYHERYYLLYGFDKMPRSLDVAGTLDYVKQLGLGSNYLTQARRNQDIANLMAMELNPHREDARHCDFCGVEIFGVEYETLADGRDRCMQCSRTAIKTGDEFVQIFNDVKRNMEAFFGIRINVGVHVEMCNSKKLHKLLGESFVPTAAYDGRVLGVAIRKKDGFSLYVENGSPRMASMCTIAHELTHIWQYITWDEKKLQSIYGKKYMLEIYEGMAKWVEIQYAYLINETTVAVREQINTALRKDEYGRGFLMYLANYPFSTGTVITKPTPFQNKDMPLDPQYLGAVGRVAPLEQLFPPIDPVGTPGRRKRRIPKPPRKKVTGEHQREDGKFQKYAYSHLNDAEKAAYDLIEEAVLSFKPDVSVEHLHLDKGCVDKLVDYVRRDHPEICWIGKTSYQSLQSSGLLTDFHFDYCLTKEEAEARQAEIDKAVPLFMEGVTDDLCDYDAALTIYENIIRLADYDVEGLKESEKSKPDGSKPDDLRSVYGMLVNRKGVCVGYAKATQYLLNQMGINCTMVTGMGEKDLHAWNLVELEGDWYYMDTTWDDPVCEKSNKPTSDKIKYDYFCITTEEMSKTHKIDDKLPVPNCAATKCNYYHRNGLFFDEYDYTRVCEKAKEWITDDITDLPLKFASKKAYQQAEKELVQQGKIQDIRHEIELHSSQKYSSSFRYSERDDIQVLCFMFEKL